jgi:transcriptional regulator with XRE-family HTH domain
MGERPVIQEPPELVALRRALGQQLAALREAAGIVQQQIGHKTGYSRSSVAKAEAGSQLLTREFWKTADGLLQADGGLLASYEQVRAAKQEHEARSREAELAKAYAEAQAHAQALREATTTPSPRQNGGGLVVPTGQDVLAGLVASVGAELAGGLAGPLLYLVFLSSPSQVVSIEWRDQLYEQLAKFLHGWANTVERRELLRLMGWVATTVAASPVSNLDSEDQERLVKAAAASCRVDTQVIDTIEIMLQHCKRQEDALGSRMVLDTVLAQRHLVHGLLVDCPSMLRPRLLSVYSDMSTSIGYYFFDLDDHASAMHYCDQARVAAHDAGNTDLGIYALCEMSYFASWQGKAPASIDLAASAESLLSKTDDPLMRVGVAQRAATAYATDGQHKACMVKLERAQESLVSAGQVSVESPLYFYNEGYLTSHRSECLLRLGKPQEAAASASAGLMLYDKSFVDGYAVCTLHLGNARLQAGEVEEAVRVIGSAASLAAQTCSARLMKELHTTRDRMQPWQGTRAVGELDERLAECGLA